MRAATAAAVGAPGDSRLWLGLPDVAVSTMDQMRGFGAEDTSLWPLGDAAGVRADDSESDSEASDKLPPPCCRPCRGSSDECDAPLGRRRSVRSEDRESSSTSTKSSDSSRGLLRVSERPAVPAAAAINWWFLRASSSAALAAASDEDEELLLFSWRDAAADPWPSLESCRAGGASSPSASSSSSHRFLGDQVILFSFFSRRRAFANHVDTCVSVIFVIMASMIFSPFVG